jgi:nucleoside-diphosphate-sugar epimerase
VTDVQLPSSSFQHPVLITGVNGFIAGHLAERLCREGVPVRGLARRPETAGWLARKGVKVIPGDLLDVESVVRSMAGCRAMVHAASWTGGGNLSANLAWRTNVAGTVNALEAARMAGVERFVYVSSVAVYGLNCAPLIDESMPTPPVGQLYPDSKIAAEAEVRKSGLPYVIVRPACIYGPRGTAWTIGPVEQIKHRSLILLGRDEGLVTPGYIDNLVDGLWLALSRPAALGQTFNLCDDRSVTYREFYMAYARMLRRDRLPALPGWIALLARSDLAGLARRLVGKPTIGPWSLHFRFNPSQFSVQHAQQVLGYTPMVDFATGMRRTEAWLQASGYL